MKKLVSMLFILSLLLVPITQVLYPNTASAQDVWVCWDDSSETFVVEETCKHPDKIITEPYVFQVKAKVVRGKNYEVLHYRFYTVNRNAYYHRIPEKRYWGYATQYMNNEQYENVATDRTGRAFAVLKYCLENL